MPPTLLNVVEAGETIGRTQTEVRELIAARTAWTLRNPHRNPPGWLIPPPDRDRRRGWVWDQRTLASWAIRMGWLPAPRGGVPLIGFLGLAYQARITEQALRKLQAIRTAQIAADGVADVGAMPAPVAYLSRSGRPVRVVMLADAPHAPRGSEPLLFDQRETEPWMIATNRVTRTRTGTLVPNPHRRGGLKRGVNSDYEQ